MTFIENDKLVARRVFVRIMALHKWSTIDQLSAFKHPASKHSTNQKFCSTSAITDAQSCVSFVRILEDVETTKGTERKSKEVGK